MRCYYVNDHIAGKVLIPGCWGSAIHGIDSCTCYSIEVSPTDTEQIKQLKEEIQFLKDQLRKYENQDNICPRQKIKK